MKQQSFFLVFLTACFKLFGAAAIIISLWDLFIHSIVLIGLILSCHQSPKMMDNMVLESNKYFHPNQVPSMKSYLKQSPSLMMHNKSLHSSNIVLNHIIEKHNIMRPSIDLKTRNFCSTLDLTTIKWAAFPDQRAVNVFFLDRHIHSHWITISMTNIRCCLSFFEQRLSL